MAPRPSAREREIEEDRDDVITDPEDAGGEQSSSMLRDDDDDEEGADNAAVKRQQQRRDLVLEDEEDDRLAHNDDEDDEDRRGSSRRKRRNRARREAQAQSQAIISAMAQKIGELETQITQVSRGQIGLGAEAIESQIAVMQAEINKIDAAMARAIKEQDDATWARGQQLRDEARDRLMELQYERQRARAALDPKNQKQPPQQVAPAPDPEAVRLSNEFLDEYDWFDPASNDRDSRRMKELDAAVARAGYVPNTESYWDELRRRARAAGLKPSDDGDDDVDDDYEDRRPRRRERERDDAGGLPPRAGRGSATRRRGDGNGPRLPPLAVETLDEMGLLEKKGLTKEQLAQREKYIKTWQAGFKEASKSGRR